jgi:hypothetical protein
MAVESAMGRFRVSHRPASFIAPTAAEASIPHPAIPLTLHGRAKLGGRGAEGDSIVRYAAGISSRRAPRPRGVRLVRLQAAVPALDPTSRDPASGGKPQEPVGGFGRRAAEAPYSSERVAAFDRTPEAALGSHFEWRWTDTAHRSEGRVWPATGTDDTSTRPSAIVPRARGRARWRCRRHSSPVTFSPR